METVKVDIQKLQVLNDRIAQTIDALNQVRMSTHGLQSSQLGQVPQSAFGVQPIQQSAFGVQPTQQSAVPQSIQLGFNPAFGLGYGQPQPIPVQQGLSHSSFAQPMMQPYAQQQLQADPYWQYRVAQAFPYMAYPVAPTF